MSAADRPHSASPSAARESGPVIPAGTAPAMTQVERESIERAFDAEQRAIKLGRLRRQVTLNVTGVVLFLLLWEIAPRIVPGINLQMFPPPSNVVGTLGDMIMSGELLKHTLASLQRAVLGFMIGGSLGVLIGLLTGQLTAMRSLTDPVLHGLRSIPAIAFVPLAIVWFGLGEISKVALITWGTFFPVWLNTFIGVRDVPNVLLRSAASLGCRGRDMMFRVVLPSALPFILAGLRQATATAFVMLVAAELVGASSGLGFLISFSHLVFRVDMMFVGLMALGALGFGADRIFVALLPRIFPWYGGEARR
jgi:ABC-type nitrate/sulfonate/bicarbonate transport system permease component